MTNAENYKNPYGTWKVTTEGDCEGRTVTDLGTYTGFIDEIAFALGRKCYYVLNFKAVSLSTPKLTPLTSKVNIQLDVGSGTWDIGDTKRVAFAKELFKGRDVKVTPCNYYATFTIEAGNAEQTKRANALSKLTPEERSLLGL